MLESLADPEVSRPMALLKTRPDVRLMLPRPLVAGQLAEFIVELDCPEPVPVDAVSLTLFGDAVWYTTSQYGRHRHASRFLDHCVGLLTDEVELEAGKHRLQTKVTLSDELPGSWDGDRIAIEYGVKIHVDIPWWPDKRVEFVVRVANTQTISAPERSTTVFVSRAGGPPPKGPYLELSLGQQSVRPGGTMRMSAALGNVERNRYRKLEIEIIACESFPTGLGGSYVNEHGVARWGIGLDAHPGELQPIPFSIELPRSLAPAFEIHGCKLTWMIEVTADVPWGIDPKLRLPIHVQPRELDPDSEVAAPLAVGSDRLRLIWSSVARTTGLELDGDRLRGRAGEVRIEIRRSHDDGHTKIVSALEHPDLGVGLRPHRERRTLLGGLSTGLATRDAEQSRVVAEALGDAIADSEHELIEADDHRIVISFDSAGLQLGPLQTFVTWIVELAGRLDALPSRLPIPAVLREHADAWQAAAKALGGELRPGDLGFRVTRDEISLLIVSRFDDQGQLSATYLELDPKLAIPSRHHLIWTGDTALPEHELPVDELVAAPSWSDNDRVALHIEARRVRVLLPAALPDPMLERERIEALLSFGRRLRGEQGPYR